MKEQQEMRERETIAEKRKGEKREAERGKKSIKGRKEPLKEGKGVGKMGRGTR